MRNKTLALFFIYVSFIHFLDGFAQNQPEIKTGEHIRVKTTKLGSAWQEGILVKIDRDSLVLNSNEDVTNISLPLSSLAKIQINRGRRSGGGTGAAIGFLTGAVLGFAVGYVVDCGDDCPPLQGGATLALVGGLGGAIVGAVTKVDQWQEIPLEKVRLRGTPF